MEDALPEPFGRFGLLAVLMVNVEEEEGGGQECSHEGQDDL